MAAIMGGIDAEDPTIRRAVSFELHYHEAHLRRSACWLGKMQASSTPRCRGIWASAEVTMSLAGQTPRAELPKSWRSAVRACQTESGQGLSWTV